jgi:rhodanese-related sulfurtransferase
MSGKPNKGNAKIKFTMRTIQFILILLAATYLISGCGQVDQTVYGSVDKMVMEHQKDAPFITADRLNQCVQEAQPGVKIVDVREPDEFIAGHIPGAVNVPRGILEFSDLISNRRDHLVIYSNHENRSSLSVANLKLTKHRKVSVLKGGFEGWKTQFPESIQEGTGNATASEPARKASGGGCGD